MITMEHRMHKEDVKYIVITPARDEAKHIRATIESMIAQTIRPAEWIIVNDGSTDATGPIADEYAARYSWIRVLHRENRGFRKSGGGVVEAFNDGLRLVQFSDWDFIVKFDGDLTFDPSYFEDCFRIFTQEPGLGVGGGTICHMVNGVPQPEETPTFHVRGATKIYRRACWDGIGGFLAAPGWDTLDEVKANMQGWTTRTFPQLQLIHHRFTGSADGAWGGWVKNGRANYISGYHPVFMVAKCLSRAVRGGIFGAFALLYGFVSGYVKRIPRVSDKELIAYLRRQQLNRLLGHASIWK